MSIHLLVYLSIDPPFVHWSISIPNVNVYEYVPIYRFSPQRAAAALRKFESDVLLDISEKLKPIRVVIVVVVVVAVVVVAVVVAAVVVVIVVVVARVNG